MVEAGEGDRHDGQLSDKLAVLSAGAAQSVVSALATLHGIELQVEFGAVGAMRQRLLDGAPCDVVVLTRSLIDQLDVVASADIGSVQAVIAVRESDANPPVQTREQLRAALASADAIYLPDPAKATAGAHFAQVLEKLGVNGRLRVFPNGATAMRELARSRDAKVIGCTQATEIIATPGAKVVAPLPGEFALATTYTAGIIRDSPLARRFLELLLGSRDLKMKAGFHP